MFKSIQKVNIAMGLAALLLGGGCLGMSLLYMKETEKTRLLEKQLTELDKKEKRAIIEQHINKQMEDIAYEQKKISDERTEEANKQAQIAEAEKKNAIASQNLAKEQAERAEEEKQKAINAQKQADENATIAEKNAIDAQKQEAIARQLRFIALGRSLGSQSSQIRSSNEQLADLLAYASYFFTNKYKQRESDLYNGAVFQALTEGSHTMQTWMKHKGSTMAISFMTNKDEDCFVTVSNYGEIKRHIYSERMQQIITEDIYANSQYDFRDVYVDNQNTIYALSHTGHLIVKKEEWNASRVIMLPEIQNALAISKINNSDSTIALVGTQSIGIFSMKDLTLKGTKAFDFNIVSVGVKETCPLLFDNRGRMHSVKGLDNIVTSSVPAGINGQVTAYANSSKAKLEAFGTKEGIIYVRPIGGTSHILNTLAGHESKITRLKMDNTRLYSSSLDGKLNLWVVNENEKSEPLTLLDNHEWMMYFDINRSKDRVWTGGQLGTITKSLINIRRMRDKLLNETLVRDFTDEEWNSYIGADVPKESFIKDRGKEVKP